LQEGGDGDGEKKRSKAARRWTWVKKEGLDQQRGYQSQALRINGCVVLDNLNEVWTIQRGPEPYSQGKPFSLGGKSRWGKGSLKVGNYSKRRMCPRFLNVGGGRGGLGNKKFPTSLIRGSGEPTVPQERERQKKDLARQVVFH